MGFENLPKEKTNEVLSTLGGSSNVAKTLSISRQAVHKWRETGIPTSRFMELLALRKSDLKVRGTLSKLLSEWEGALPEGRNDGA